MAILSTIVNICLEYARSQGIIVSWWRKALRSGTLTDLNNYWEFGDSLLAAGTAGWNFKFVHFSYVTRLSRS
ncbi:hypothetical protein B0O99DRAFT_619734 [Bisporella sp. PMI_857]|nr:hypothetical protein B0O99DRAFT_619734 [Bisporella sp. PMI_857]